MRISIITVSYNSERTIEETIQSVINQSYKDIEYIIVDGNSTDKTTTIIDRYRNNISKIICEPDQGLWDAMNKGIETSSGDAFCFLNSDDTFASTNTVSLLAESLKKSNSDAIFGFVNIVDAQNPKKIIRKYRVSKITKTTLRMGIMPAHPGFLCRRHFFDEHGGFTLFSEKYAPDFELIARYYTKGKMQASVTPHVIINMRHGGVGNSSIKYRIRRYKKIVNSCKKNNIWTSLFITFLKIPYRTLEYIK